MQRCCKEAFIETCFDAARMLKYEINGKVASEERFMQRTRPLFLKIIFLLLTFFIMISSFHIMDNTARNTTAEKGHLDLSWYDFEQKGKLSLDGEWQFYYQRFVEPVSYTDLPASDRPDVYITPPTVWNYYEVNGKPIPGFGYGTYRMIVTGVTPDMTLAIKILPQSTAYDLYIDDVLMAESGKVDKDQSKSAAGYRPGSIKFTPHTTEFIITVHISNYVYARGGMWDAPTLGTKAQIESLDRFILHRDLFLQGCYFISFLMFLVMFINRPRNRSWIYFAILCAVTASRILIYGAHLIIQYTENFRLITFLEYGTRYWFPLLLLLLLNDELCGKIPEKLLKGLTLFISAITVATAILPIPIYTAFAKAVITYDFILGLGIIVLLLWPGERFFPKNENKIFFIYGITAINICAVYDMYFASTAYFEMTPIGFFVALLAFAFVLAITYSDALTNCENALRELENEGERKLQTELKLLQSQIRPHFLYNALSAIANVCGKDGKKAEQLILDLAYFMQASFDFRSNEKMTSLENELEYIRKYVNIEKARFGDKIRYTEQIDVPLSTQLPRLIIEPLVENAIRHGISKKKGGGEVILRVSEVPEGLFIEVRDDGIGITKERLPDLFGEESKGVGLKNIQDRLVHSGGTGLKIESVQNDYTKVNFIIKGGN